MMGVALQRLPKLLAMAESLYFMHSSLQNDDDDEDTNEENTMNGGVSSSSNDGGLLCDNTNPEAGNNAAAAGSGGGPGGETPNVEAAGGNSDNNDPGSVGAQVKQEDVKPNVSNCSTPLQQQNASSVLPSDTDLFDGFDSKDGGKLFGTAVVEC